MSARGHDITVLPDRVAGAICLVVATAMCAGAGAVSIFGGSGIVRAYGSAFLAPPALGMLWIGLDLLSGMRLSQGWKRLSGRN
jgi:hypothetical protein